jgi:hypothetical protein
VAVGVLVGAGVKVEVGVQVGGQVGGGVFVGVGGGFLAILVSRILAIRVGFRGLNGLLGATYIVAKHTQVRMVSPNIIAVRTVANRLSRFISLLLDSGIGRSRKEYFPKF